MSIETPDVQQQRQSYDEIWEKLSKGSYRAQQHLKNRIYAITRFLETLNITNPDILEIGCGYGVITDYLSRFGRVVGMDLSPKGVELARKLHPDVEFFHGDLLNYEFDDRKYDVIVHSEVLEHIPVDSRERFMDVVAGLLRPDGYMIFTTPNKQLSDRVSTFQLIEEHFYKPDLEVLVNRHFDICQITTIHRLFPVLGHKSKTLQAIRAGMYEILGLRRWIENPLRKSDSGLYFAVLARLRSNS